MKKKQDEPPWNRDERIEKKVKKTQTETDEENALIGLGKMFPKEAEETGNPFKPSFGAAFRKEREALKE